MNLRSLWKTRRKAHHRLVPGLRKQLVLWQRCIFVTVALSISSLARGEGQKMTSEDYYKSAGQKVKNRDFKGALSDLDKALESNPKLVKALINRGILYDELGDR